MWVDSSFGINILRRRAISLLSTLSYQISKLTFRIPRAIMNSCSPISQCRGVCRAAVSFSHLFDTQRSAAHRNAHGRRLHQSAQILEHGRICRVQAASLTALTTGHGPSLRTLSQKLLHSADDRAMRHARRMGQGGGPTVPRGRAIVYLTNTLQGDRNVVKEIADVHPVRPLLP